MKQKFRSLTSMCQKFCGKVGLTIFFVFSLNFLITYSISAQETPLFRDIHTSFNKGKDYYAKKLYSAAKESMLEFINENSEPISEFQKQYLLEAKQIIAISALMTNEPQGEKKLTDFIEKNSPDPIIVSPVQVLASYYYNEKQYAKSVYFYDKIDASLLTEEEWSEVNFKKGYSLFVQKDFSKAKSQFFQVKDFRNKFYYPVNYYFGMCQYFSDEYDSAVKSFERVSSSTAYSPLIPYYISQIYFAEDEFEKLINYGEKIIQQPQVQQKKNIRLLLGQAYFKNDLYDKALPHLTYYEKNTDKLTKEEFYQLAFSQYQLKEYKNAIKNFQELALLDSKLGQLVNYYLADCFLKTDDLQSSRTAFKKVSQMPYEPKMQEEATFNYGKLSAQLNFDRESINTLVRIQKSSPYFRDSRKIINDLLLNSGDYTNSISIIEGLDNLTEDLKSTYQIVSFNKALQELQENDHAQAKYYFTKSKIYPENQNLSVQAEFWQAYMLHKDGDFKSSISAFDTYFRNAPKTQNLPEEASLLIANYTQGYNYLKISDYNTAEDYFKEAVFEMNSKRESLQNEIILNRVLPDALLRAGDCLFKQNEYENAMIYYDQSISRQSAGFMYAMYQKGVIQGLLSRPYEKIITLEELAGSYPASEYADDALVQLGDTYLGLGNTGPASIAFNRVVTYYKGKSNLINSSYLKLGIISYNQGDTDSALKYYKEVFKNNPNSKESQEALLAIEEIYIDDLADSDSYIAFLETVPGFKVSAFARDSINYQIAKSQFDNGDYERSIESYNGYLSKFPAGYYRLAGHYYRGEANSILKNYKGALGDYGFLVDEGINEFYQRSLRKAALISYNYTQNFTRAFRYYRTWETSTEDEAEKYEAQIGALRSAFRTSQHNETKEYANRVINNALASENDKSSAYYYLGKASYNTEQKIQAQNAFSKISQGRNNQSAEANYMIALIYFQDGNMKLAEKQINFTTENSSAYPYWVAKAIILYSDLYLAANDLFNARAALEAVIENFKDDEDLVNTATDKLKIINDKEEESSRIKNLDPNAVELDTIGGNE